jgi:hypothetical protein
MTAAPAIIPLAQARQAAVSANPAQAPQHHDVEEAASAAAVGAALIGPFLLAGAVALRALRKLTRHTR